MDSSLDREMKIYIKESERAVLFNELHENENNKAFFKLLWSAENLERYCMGKTGLADYAYSHIRVLLKKEYAEWKKAKNNVKP